MIKMGQQTLVKNLPRFLAPGALALRFSAACPSPVLLRELARSVRVAAPALRAIPAMLVTHPSLRFNGSANSNTLVGASLLRSVVNRHFSTESKPGTPVETLSSGLPKSRSDWQKYKIAEARWSHILYKVNDQYYLRVLCGTIAKYSLNLALGGAPSLNALAAKIRSSQDSYMKRCIEVR